MRVIVDLATSEHGTGDPPLVLVHGFTGSRLDWADVVGPLGEHRRVLTIDHRGHGESPHLGSESEYSFAALLGDLHAWVDARGLDRFDLLGHSLGGMIAMRYALANPGRLRSLVLMDTAPGPLAGDDGFLRGGVEAVRANGLAATFAHIESLFPDDPASQRTLGRMRVKWGQMDAAAFCGLGTELLDHVSVEDLLPRIAAPTTVIVGELDAPFRSPSERMAAAIPDARLVIIPGAAHSPQDEQTAAWLDAVEAHLARVTEA